MRRRHPQFPRPPRPGNRRSADRPRRGLRIESGDIVIGDRDGIVVVPRARAQATLAPLADVREGEAALEAKVKAGLKVPDFVRAILESDRVRRID